VKGKTETTRIFELLAPGGQLSEDLERLRKCYEQGRHAFLAREWDLAEASFRECLQLRPNDGPSQVLVQPIQMLRQNPPGKDWNGAWQLVEK
jgi:adenylate cyclase